MTLNGEQQKIVLEKLKYFIHKSCDVCSGKEWVLSPTIFEVREFSGGGFETGGKNQVFPLIALSCKSCGYTHYFNTILMGITPKQEDGK
ncbi:MAG: hypothetical protein WCX77_04130 [Candidatus Paceibacterota bacterium]|jgi:hypothetical protein